MPAKGQANRPKRKGPKPLSARGYTPGTQIKPERAKVLSPFARWLKAIRVRSTWRGEPITQELLAHATGISKFAIAKYERDEHFPKLDDLPILADFFNVDQAEIYAMTYNLPPGIYLFLTTTREGVQVVKNIEAIMRRVKAEGGPTPRQDMPEGMELWEDETDESNNRINHFSRLDLERSLGAAPRGNLTSDARRRTTREFRRIGHDHGGPEQTPADREGGDG